MTTPAARPATELRRLLALGLDVELAEVLAGPAAHYGRRQPSGARRAARHARHAR